MRDRGSKRERERERKRKRASERERERERGTKIYRTGEREGERKSEESQRKSKQKTDRECLRQVGNPGERTRESHTQSLTSPLGSLSKAHHMPRWHLPARLAKYARCFDQFSAKSLLSTNA